MKSTPTWAVCPRAHESEDQRTPRQFETLKQANRFLNAEPPRQSVAVEARATGMSVSAVLQHRAAFDLQRREALRKLKTGELSPLQFPEQFNKIPNRRRGWESPIPIKTIAIGGATRLRSFRDFLPLSAVAKRIPDRDFEDLLRDACLGNDPAVSCYLDSSWGFEGIAEDCQKRPGHRPEGRNHESISEAVVKCAYDLDDSLVAQHPSISGEGIADFFGSWQVWRHVAEFCSSFGDSPTAKALVSHPWEAPNDAKKARDFLYKEFFLYVHEIRPRREPEQRVKNRQPPSEVTTITAHAVARPSRASATITNLQAAKKMDAYRDANGIGLTEFAVSAVNAG